MNSDPVKKSDCQSISAFVLAGGRSSRFPPNKAFACFRGRPLIEHALKTLAEITPSLAIVGPPAEYSAFGVPVFPDLVESRGPLGGIYTALKCSATPVILVLACDMPLVNPDFFRQLIREIPLSQAVVMRHADGMPEPLCAAYSLSFLSAAEHQLALGENSMLNFLKVIQVRYIEEREFRTRGWPLEMMTSVNTPEDFERFESWNGKP